MCNVTGNAGTFFGVAAVLAFPRTGGVSRDSDAVLRAASYLNELRESDIVAQR